jgi:four helix bundle protein
MNKSFRDLIAFKLAIELASQVYDATSNFPIDERYGLRSQLRRSSASVYAQIAEGNGRFTYGEWRQFLSQARGSLFEVEGHLEFALKRQLIASIEVSNLRKTISRVAGAINGLVKWLQREQGKSRSARLRSIAHLARVPPR